MLLRSGVCICFFALCLYSYLDTQNALTHLKIKIPQIEKEIQLIREENSRLAYEVGQFENPTNLIELAARPEYSHLKHPLLKEELTVPEAWASN